MSDKPTPPNPPLSDGVVVLRPFRAEDAPAITAACQDPEIGRWVPIIPAPYGEANARAFILMTLQAWHEGTGCEFAIADAATDRYVGSIGLHLGSNPRRHSIGYLIAPEFRGRGYATRALRLLTRWGFEQFGIERLALWTLIGNAASQQVAEKAGFRFEGLARNWETGRDGKPIDAVMYSMTPEDLADAEAAAAAEAAGAGAAGVGAAAAGAVDADLADAASAAAAAGSTAGASAGRRPLAHVAEVPPGLRAPGSRAAPFVEVAAVADLAPGTMRRVTRADLDLLVAWIDDGIVVTDDRCPHMAAPLSAGELAGCVVACPLHEGRFDLRTGDTVQMPTTGGLDADGNYHEPWSPAGAEPKPDPPRKKAEARRLTRVNRLRYYPARIRDGRLEAQLPIIPE
jgi:RimJ/RimL family protein N-acetyltransferase/nitrite reductase/ring-hydroxylating ferredoxin subunit